jgi:hypothetical protein
LVLVVFLEQEADPLPMQACLLAVVVEEELLVVVLHGSLPLMAVEVAVGRLVLQLLIVVLQGSLVVQVE